MLTADMFEHSLSVPTKAMPGGLTPSSGQTAYGNQVVNASLLQPPSFTFLKGPECAHKEPIPHHPGFRKPLGYCNLSTCDPRPTQPSGCLNWMQGLGLSEPDGLAPLFDFHANRTFCTKRLDLAHCRHSVGRTIENVSNIPCTLSSASPNHDSSVVYTEFRISDAS